MELKDVKLTAADKKKQAEKWASPASDDGIDDYPYGLQVHLNADIMEKLGLTEKDFDAGQPVMVVAEGFISEDSVRTVNGNTMRSMSIQFRKMAVDQGGEKPSISGAMYGE